MNRKDLNILVVEDDPIIATDLKSLLVHEGFKIAGVAKNALKAMDLLSSAKPNFVILDIHLGSGQNGIHIAEILHEKYHIPYIFLTSFSDELTLEIAQEQGPYGYLVKPFQERTLITTIRTAWQNYMRILKPNDLDLASLNLSLTEQEVNISIKLSQGDSYKQICNNLSISINTLKYHVKNIYTKFDVNGRAELTAFINGHK